MSAIALSSIPTVRLGARVSVLYHGDGVVRERSADDVRGVRYRVALDSGETVWASGADVFPMPDALVVGQEDGRAA